MIVYLVWANDEGGDDCNCPYPKLLEGVFSSKKDAEEVAKRRWGGRVDEQKVLDKAPNY